MAGTWTTQNKVRPGAYINVKGAPQPRADTSIGRTLLINCNTLDWGKKGVIELDAQSDFKALLGVPLTDPKLKVLRETLKGALTVLFLNNNDGLKAKLEEAALPWTFEAKYAGIKGNDLKITLEKDPDDETRITVSTIYGAEVVDQQIIRPATAQGLQSNDYVEVTYTSDMTEAGEDKPATNKLEALPTAQTYSLAGGTTEPVEVTDLLNEVLETEQFNVATAAGFAPDNNIHPLLATAIQRLREDEGYKVRAVVPIYEGGYTYDYEGVSVVANGVVLESGETIDVTTATGYFAGVSSSADAGTSLTYAEYPKAITVYPKLNNEQTVKALNNGWIVFTAKRGGRVVIEQDINSLHTFTEDKPQGFSKNRTIRTLDEIVMDTEKVFEETFIGKVNNDATGRDLFKANRVGYLKDLQGKAIITDFVPEDLTVDPGEQKDAILVKLAVTPVESMEKLYMIITVF